MRNVDLRHVGGLKSVDADVQLPFCFNALNRVLQQGRRLEVLDVYLAQQRLVGAGDAQDFLNVFFRERMTRRVQAPERRYLIPTHGVFPFMAPGAGTVVLELRRVRTLIQRMPDAPLGAGGIGLDAIQFAVQWQPGLAIVLIKPKGVAAQVVGQRHRMRIGIDARLAETYGPVDTPLHQAFDEH